MALLDNCNGTLTYDNYYALTMDDTEVGYLMTE